MRIGKRHTARRRPVLRLPYIKVLCITVLVELCLVCVGVTSADSNSWTNIGPKGDPIVALVIDPKIPTTLYAWVSGTGLYKTTNGGGDWHLVNDELRPSKYAGASQLVIDPSDPTIIYAGTDRDGIFKTRDAGKSWKPVNTGLPRNSLRVFALAIDRVVPRTLYAGTDHGIFKSTNSGESWFPVNTGLPNRTIRALAKDPTNHNTIYAGMASGVAKTTDGGATWSLIRPNQTRYILSIVVDPSAPNIVYTGTFVDGTFKSTDGGATWKPLKLDLDTAAHVAVLSWAIDANPQQTIYAGGFGGVFRSTDQGETWVALNTGLGKTEVTALVLDSRFSKTLYAIAGGELFIWKDSIQNRNP